MDTQAQGVEDQETSAYSDTQTNDQARYFERTAELDLLGLAYRMEAAHIS